MANRRFAQTVLRKRLIDCKNVIGEMVQ